METICLIVISVLSFFLAVAALMIAWTRYKMNIKIWLYSHGVTWVKERDIDHDKLYDAFISFNSQDEKVIPELIDVIQKTESRIRMFIHYRDFVPDLFIEENITRAVRNSKRTVIVLSRNFLKSEWCLFEFQTARDQAIRDRTHRVIIIKFDDLPEESEIPEGIQKYLESTVYLTWGDKYFWNKLLYYLPTSPIENSSYIA